MNTDLYDVLRSIMQEPKEDWDDWYEITVPKTEWDYLENLFEQEKKRRNG